MTRRAGRPRKPAGEKRVPVKVYLTQEEIGRIEDEMRVTGEDRSVLIRRAISALLLSREVLHGRATRR